MGEREQARLSGHGLGGRSAAGEGTGAKEVAEGTLERAAEAGIHAIPLPTPFAVGRVNVYLIEDEPLTLVDTGPTSARSLDELERGLARLDRRIEDLGQIVLTHEHVDHIGLASILARRSGAEVTAIDQLGPRLADYSAQAAADDDFAARTMLRHGIEPDVVAALRSVAENLRAWGAPVSVDRGLADGERIELAERALELQHRPGHSPTDTLLWDAERRLVIGGDHLLANISSNPLLTRLPGTEGTRRRALVEYLESLARTRELPAELILPGHGPPVSDHASLIDSRFHMHERRARKLRRLLEPAPLTAHQLARRMWGQQAIRQAFLTLSEVLGHLDLLLERGEARELEGEVVRFEAV